MKALKLKIHGKVQWVGFRASTQQVAQALDVQGWVRNTPDGSVEIHVQGENDKVGQLLEWCNHGPPGADVKRMDVLETNPDETIMRFSILF
ncbi:MAG: acylphosphatase [Deltaproteobacteria bacterium]|nr:acylphosphatase [Deltaproteobacteria bacterium]